MFHPSSLVKQVMLVMLPERQTRQPLDELLTEAVLLIYLRQMNLNSKGPGLLQEVLLPLMQVTLQPRSQRQCRHRKLQGF
jgi:hypothetical protein